MGSYPEKPIRVDYFPKTKESTEKSEESEIINDMDKEIDFRIVDEIEPVEKEIVKHDEYTDECIAEDIETIEGFIEEEMTDDITENMVDDIMENMAGDIKEEAIGDTEETEETIEDEQEVTEEEVEDKKEN